MSQRHYLSVTFVIFTLVGVMHALRLFYGWPVVFGGTVIPLWASWVGVAVAFLLAVSAKKLLKK
jgi:hypothetical protein